jgi:tRNA-2-methylthio-N6-dimethylallyladenosine synthase
MARKYFIETYGCQMNVHDSERMAGLLDQAGYEATADDPRRRPGPDQHLQRP